MVAGVYQILNKETGSRFIAGSTNVTWSLNWYLSAFTEGRLENLNCSAEEDSPFNRMAKDWAVYGAQSFSLNLLEETTRSRVLIQKRFLAWCRQLNPSYNGLTYPPVVSGIYQLLNSVTSESYIGQSGDIYLRWGTHKAALRSNKHPNLKLQKSWNNYGAEQFTVNILEECLPNKTILLLLERSWINRSKNLFNIH